MPHNPIIQSRPDREGTPLLNLLLLHLGQLLPSALPIRRNRPENPISPLHLRHAKLPDQTHHLPLESLASLHFTLNPTLRPSLSHRRIILSRVLPDPPLLHLQIIHKLPAAQP